MELQPAFGQADLTNCERELIHLAGSIQPHGVLLVVRESDLVVRQVSANSALVLGAEVGSLLERPVSQLGGDLEAAIRSALAAADDAAVWPLRAHTVRLGRRREFEGSVHRAARGRLIVELEPLDPDFSAVEIVAAEQPGRPSLTVQLRAAVQRFSATASIGVLVDGVARCLRDLTGYDRVMVYKFDPDGHGKITAEARDPRLESLLGHHYPATDIPQRARELYLRTRVRVLVDVFYQPAPIVPRLDPDTQQELDMSLSYLRSMSPLHIQYLKNMGVTATLVISLVREGRLWGLIACHHYSPRNLRYAVRAACELLGEVISTRIAAIENYAHAQVAVLVRRLEQRLIEATSTEGDWRLALFRSPRTLLAPLEATGAVLFHDGEVLTAGDVPSTPELRSLLNWVDEQAGTDMLFSCSSVAAANPALDSLTPTASGVLAVRLSASRPDFLLWLRKEQLCSVTWAGDPTKPMVGDDPLELSPRRSFAAWSEIVRGTALPWSSAEITLARAIGVSLIDIIVQVHAVRLLIAEHQLRQVRSTVQTSSEPVVIFDAGGGLLFANDAFVELAGRARLDCRSFEDFAQLFDPAGATRSLLEGLRTQHQPWRRELTLLRPGGVRVPLAVRTEVVPGRDGAVLGFMLIAIDLRDRKRADAAREQLERLLSQAARGEIGAGTDARGSTQPDDIIGAILTNTSLAAMDIADAAGTPAVAPLLEELEASARRSTRLYAQVRTFSGER